MNDPRSNALEYAHNNQSRFLEELKDLIRIPSISTDPEHKQDMNRAAEWLAAKLRSYGAQKVQVFPTAGHSVVYGELLHQSSDHLPTVLLYGHYDVQPPDPLELWKSAPFEPEQRGDNLYARGASDMKGQVMASLSAVESMVKNGGVPVNLKFVIEGEEEIGSVNLDPFMRSHRDLLACDVALNPDTGMIAADIPTIVYGLRGLAYFELRVFGPDHDLHSGMFGGVVHNPAQALCELIAGMHDSNGTITLPGFYDRVAPVTSDEHAEFARLPIDNAYYLEKTGVPALWGEKEFLPAERVGARPTLDVNGILSGFTAEGQKTVIPTWAMAKISTRLVPNQVPEEIEGQFREYLNAKAPKTIRWELKKLSSGSASLTPRDLPETKALAQALNAVWGKPPAYKREGGSVPVVAQFQEILGVESVCTGFGLPDDNIHAPNEKLNIPTWKRGIDAVIHFFYNLAQDR
jgi:acetylornithine deacetylase/succinyl-diaminopimelate desuccinylase-like protein